jgi:hypothetical protein
MARMFPSRLPDEIVNEPLRAAEVEVYKSLKNQLSDEFNVYYSSPWLGIDPSGREIDGEADFIVAHRDKGIVSIEVKGGRVEIDSDNRWTSKDRKGIERSIKNPVSQARSSKYQLLKQLNRSVQWKRRYICASHGVILNDVERPARDLRPDMPLKLFAFREDMKYLDHWINDRLDQAEDSDSSCVEPLGDDGMFALDDLLARPIQLRVRLHTSVEKDLKDIKLLTRDQIWILRDLENNKRMAIAGAAGTGKTVLAVEKAMILEEQGKRTLLLCYNKPLSVSLQIVLESNTNITAMHFHQFCLHVATVADGAQTASIADLEARLVENFIQSGVEAYDAVIIDEGQDFRDEWLQALEVVVKDMKEGVLYIFYDDNQDVMSASAQYIFDLPMAKYHLSRNFRNTKAIFKQADYYYSGSFVRPIGPEGKELGWYVYNSYSELKKKLTERVGNLIQAEGINPGDIAILFPNITTLDSVFPKGSDRVGHYNAGNAENRSQDRLVLDTVRRFKGLESPVVLLLITHDVKAKTELLYTGMTRAQSLLDLFSPPSLKASLINEGGKK